MIYYIFYLKESYQLYAFTKDKKLNKKFKSNRNMNEFIVEKEDLSKEDENLLIKNYLNRDIILFKGKTIGKKYKLVNFEIPITQKEKLTLLQNRSLYCNEKLYNTGWSNPLILKDKYFKVLLNIGYVDIANNIFTQQIFPDNWNKEVQFVPDDFQMLLLAVDKKLFI